MHKCTIFKAIWKLKDNQKTNKQTEKLRWYNFETLFTTQTISMYAVEKEEKTDTDVSQSASQLSEWVSEYVKQWQCFGDRNTHVKKRDGRKANEREKVIKHTTCSLNWIRSCVYYEQHTHTLIHTAIRITLSDRCAIHFTLALLSSQQHTCMFILWRHITSYTWWLLIEWWTSCRTWINRNVLAWENQTNLTQSLSPSVCYFGQEKPWKIYKPAYRMCIIHPSVGLHLLFFSWISVISFFVNSLLFSFFAATVLLDDGNHKMCKRWWNGI